MKVLVISNMYPKGKSNDGVFIKRELNSLERIDIEVTKVVKTQRNLLGYIPFLLRYIFLLLYKSYDLIHAHYGFHSALFAAVIKRKPLTITFHGSDALKEPSRNKTYYKLQKFVISRCDYIIAVSNEIRNVLISNLGAEPTKISVVSCGVDTSIFTPLEKIDIRRKLKIARTEKVILFIGRLSYKKGINIIFECAQRMPDVNFILVGKGTLRTNIKNCRFVGSRPNDEIPVWVNAADVFVLPSKSEGTPVVLLEALSCGIPVVASKVGGIPNLVKNGETGYLVEPEDVSMFEKRLRELLENPEKRRQMGQQGRKDMIENYDSQKIAERISQVYKKVLSKK